MTVTEDLIDLFNEIDLADLDPALTHIQCCENDEFFCGAPFHPEMSTIHKDDAGCSNCVTVFAHYTCGKRGVPHLHCPFRGHACSEIQDRS